MGVAIHRPIIVGLSCEISSIFDGNLLWVVLAVVTNSVVHREQLELMVNMET